MFRPSGEFHQEKQMFYYWIITIDMDHYFQVLQFITNATLN